jgi:A/G-specific adenine glycosylase
MIERKKNQLSSARIRTFQKTIYDYLQKHGRSLPWRKNITSYKVFISEVMLQQTQVERVAPKFVLFIKEFPSFNILAKSPLAKILKAWSGLGYNRRALALRQAAEIIVKKYHGRLPQNIDDLQTLPGIGPATAAAIIAYAFNKPSAYIETNIRTVYIHAFFKDKKEVSDDEILPLVTATLDRKNPCRWYSALMDYGVMLKEKHGNISRRSVHYTKQSPFAGSHRQLRGRVLKILIQKKSISTRALLTRLGETAQRTDRILHELQTEGFVSRHNAVWRII